jgi:hypothetical protein
MTPKNSASGTETENKSRRLNECTNATGASVHGAKRPGARSRPHADGPFTAWSRASANR